MARSRRDRRGGLATARRPEPGDLLYRYLTPEEIFGPAVRFDEPLTWLAGADRETTLRELAFWLARFDAQEGLTTWKQIEREWVESTILDPHRSRLLTLLRGNTTLVSPQSLMILMKRVIKDGASTEDGDMRPLLMAAIAIQGQLGRERPPDDDEVARRLALVTEVMRIQEFHRRPDRAMRVAQAQIRWLGPRARADLAAPLELGAAFEAVTGVALLDVQSVGFALFAHAIEKPGGAPTITHFADFIGWAPDRLERVLALIARSVADMAIEIRAEEERMGGEAWTFETLRRFPVLRLDNGRLLTLSPALVLERTLGWLPVFEMTVPEQPAPEVARLAVQARAAMASICEREVIETITANVASGRKRGRLFDGAILRATYPEGMIADAAIAYGDEWVVVEVSSGQLRRSLVVGGAEGHLDDDLARLIDDKVDQIASTIAHLRLTADLDLRVLYPGSGVVSSVSYDNSYEFVSFTATTSGTVTIQVSQSRFDRATEFWGLAWLKY